MVKVLFKINNFNINCIMSNMTKYIVSLSTIPSKFDTIHFSIDSLINQTLKPKKIIINIPKTYSFRFNSTSIPDEKISKFIEKYSQYNVFINFIDNDYGPGTKLLGLFNNIISIDESIENTYVVILDDDLSYKPDMLEYFNNYIDDKDISVASYDVYRYNDIDIGQGSDGIFMKVSTLTKFIQYYNEIKDMEYINYHDDMYIAYYFFLINKSMHFIHYPHELVYNKTSITTLDALHELKGIYNRDNISIESYKILVELNKQGKFDFLKDL